MTHPIDAELFHRTAPQWNCVGYPGDGMHYVNRNGDCQWCGMTRAQVTAERHEREAASEAGNGEQVSINPFGANCPTCGIAAWDFTSPGRARCAYGHDWDQAPDIPGTFVRPGYPGDINDPERYAAED